MGSKINVVHEIRIDPASTRNRLAEFWSACVLISWGLWNALIKTDLDLAKPYDLITDVLSPERLEIAAIVIGLAQLYFLNTGSKGGRMGAAFAAGWLYTLFVVSFISSQSRQPGIVFVLGWVAVNFYGVVRVARGRG